MGAENGIYTIYSANLIKQAFVVDREFHEREAVFSKVIYMLEIITQKSK